MKKILFILLSIFCFIGITNAKDYKDLKLKWNEEFYVNIDYFETIDENIFLFSDEIIMKYSKDGKTKEELSFLNGEIIRISPIGDKYIVLTRELKEETGYTYNTYQLDKKYNLITQDSIYTGSIEVYNVYYYEDKVYLGDYTKPFIEFDENYKIIVPNEDKDDNSYVLTSGTKIEKINKDKEIIKSLSGSYTTKINGNYYIVSYTYETTGYNYTITKYDSDLNVINSVVNELEQSAYNYTEIDGIIYLECTNEKKYKVNEKLVLEEVTTIPNGINYTIPEKENFYDYYEDEKYKEIRDKVIESMPTTGYSNITSFYKDEEGGAVISGIHSYSYTSEDPNFVFVQVYDKDGKIIFNKNVYSPTEDPNNNYDSCGNNVSATKIGNYIFVAYDLDEDDTMVVMKVYDLEGNLIDELNYTNEEKMYIAPQKIQATENGLILLVSSRAAMCITGNTVGGTIPSYLSLKNRADFLDLMEYSAVYYYEFPFEVTTKSDGNGTITATKVKALSGEVIEYEVKPKEGYVLGEVKVIDEYGNAITFTNNKFTMPSANVTIEASFVVENVDTADIAICTILILGLIGIFFIVSNKTKINYINN